MDGLITVEEFIKRHPVISRKNVMEWIHNGMKHINKRPFLIKEEWVEEYIEKMANENVTADIAYVPKHKFKKVTPIRNDLKVTLEDLM